MQDLTKGGVPGRTCTNVNRSKKEPSSLILRSVRWNARYLELADEES
jgi:hypothetical protein